MKIEERNMEGALVAAVAGRIDTRTAGELEAWAREALGDPDRDLIMDFSAMDYISSAGLRVLLNISRQLQAASRSFALCNVQEHVAEVLEISGFDSFIPVYADEEQALAAVVK